MSLGKQAKILSSNQIKTVLRFLEETRYPLRNKCIFRLSLHGLRAREIADLMLSMVTDATGDVSDTLALTDSASKGRSGRHVPMSKELQSSIREYLDSDERRESSYLITSERSEKFSANAVTVLFKRWFEALGFEGASSHSGRRTFITAAARKIGMAGGSLKDVQELAGHRYLSSTQRYIERDVAAQRKIVDMLF